MFDRLLAVSARVQRGDVTCRRLAELCLARADAVEPWLHAFAWLDGAAVVHAAAAMDSRLAEFVASSRSGEADEWTHPSAQGRGPAPQGGTAVPAPQRRPDTAFPLLAGIPVGIKDIVDTAGIPTECGAALFVGRVPPRSAALVDNLEQAGAIIFGKTVTAECAFLHPGPTRNPWDPSRTPGGSSMGSAAAVGAGVIPVAVGSQTNGSIIRPAAFCGVVGFKPTYGRISTTGVLPFSPRLDQMGGFARTVEEVARLAAAMAGTPLGCWWNAARNEPALDLAAMRFAAVRTTEWAHAEPAMRERFEADVAALRAAGAVVEEPVLPGGLDEVALPVHRTIMQHEAAASLGDLIRAHPEQVSDLLRTYVEAGAEIPRDTYDRALAARDRLTTAFQQWAMSYDALLTPPATGEAPGPATTGDPRFCTRWTLVGAPALSLPTGRSPAGLPLGLQLVGSPGEDRRLLHAAAAVERTIGIGVPPLVPPAVPPGA